MIETPVYRLVVDFVGSVTGTVYYELQQRERFYWKTVAQGLKRADAERVIAELRNPPA